jgi:hypothetical protein
MKLECIGLKGGMDLGGQDLRAQIYGQERIPEAPRHSTFKRRGGGGGPESSAQLLKGQDLGPKSAAEASFRTPLAFLPLIGGGGGGGGPESNTQLFKGQDRST